MIGGVIIAWENRISKESTAVDIERQERVDKGLRLCLVDAKNGVVKNA